MAPVGQACWQGATTQCLQTSLIISQRPGVGEPGASAPGGSTASDVLRSGRGAGVAVGRISNPSSSCAAGGEEDGLEIRPTNCSTNFTCRYDVAESSCVLSWPS